MPAKSEAQRRLMAVARYSPDKLYKKNRGVLKMSDKQMEDFMKSSKKKKKKASNSIRSMIEGNVSIARKVARKLKEKFKKKIDEPGGKGYQPSLGRGAKLKMKRKKMFEEMEKELSN